MFIQLCVIEHVCICVYLSSEVQYTLAYELLCTITVCVEACVYECLHTEHTAYITVLSSLDGVLNLTLNVCSVRCNANKIIALKRNFKDKWTFIQ